MLRIDRSVLLYLVQDGERRSLGEFTADEPTTDAGVDAGERSRVSHMQPSMPPSPRTGTCGADGWGYVTGEPVFASTTDTGDGAVTVTANYFGNGRTIVVTTYPDGAGNTSESDLPPRDGAEECLRDQNGPPSGG